MPKGRKKPEETKYGALLANPDVRRWFDNLRRGSEVTADVYLRRLGGFCSSLGTTPKGLLLKSDKELDDSAMDLVTKLEKDGLAGSYIETVIKPAKSWLVFNRRELKANIKIRGTRDTPTLVNERVPTQPELKKIFLSAGTQARVACAFVSQSGLRLQVLGNYHGDDGLKVGDLPEMEVKDGKVEFLKVPSQVVVRSALSKARHQYFTFLGQEGCEYVKAYLEERIRSGRGHHQGFVHPAPEMGLKPFHTHHKRGRPDAEAHEERGLPMAALRP